MITIPSAVFSSSPRLMDFFAENPGDWANSIGIKIVNVDTGVKQQSKISVLGNWNAGTDVILNLSYNDTSKTITQTFLDDEDSTLEALANQIKTWLSTFGGAQATVVTPQYSNQKYILVIAPIAGVDMILEGWSIAGADQLRVTQTIVESGVESTGHFQVNVYSSASTVVPLDIYKCSFKQEVDENGISMFVEDVINKSNYIRVFLNGDASTMQLDGDDTEITWLSGGDDGNLPTSADVIKGWDEFSNPETTTVRTLISGGYTTPDVAKKIVSLCESRKDCFGILETPLSVQTADEVVEYRKVTLGIDSNRAALYAPGIWVDDTESGAKVMCPISGVIASKFAYVDRNFGDQYAPAGYNRSVITAGEPTSFYFEEDRDILGPAQVNYIGRHNLNLPFSIMDEKTLQSKASWLSWVHVRRTITRMEINITDALYYHLWNFIDEDSLQSLQDQAQAYGDQMVIDKRADKVQALAYSTKDDEIQGRAYLDMIIRPLGVMREIKFTTIIVNNTAEFSEEGL